MSSLHEVQDQAFKLSVTDRLTLVNLIVQSLQHELNQSSQWGQKKDSKVLRDALPKQLSKKKAVLINQMRGLLKTDAPVPTDAEIQTMLEERLVEKYL